ncbi:glycosyltransferase [Sphingobacterium multivorum]|uniref:glycosyltransferase n=1 Tax=Sphingobacterium multivorum TaxID=28454 RepID=UPI003DA483E9
MPSSLKELAIVIPAYKAVFFEEMLRSIVCQTDKRFTVYIGDDCSPDDLYSIVRIYEEDIDIVYHRFNENLGGKDLVDHWARCIDMAVDEEWIWLFSDDDLMDKDCVKNFYQTLESSNGEQYLYHFDVRIIGANGEIVSDRKSFPDKLSSVDFFKKRAANRIFSFVVEYIFSKKIYMDMNGFEKFDLAWGSDHATWIKFSSQKYICTIRGSKVSWRRSDHNISPNSKDACLSRRKVAASSVYYLWAKEFFKKEEISTYFYVRHFLDDNRIYNGIVEWKDMQSIIITFLRKINCFYIFPIVIFMFVHRKLKRFKEVLDNKS